MINILYEYESSANLKVMSIYMPHYKNKKYVRDMITGIRHFFHERVLKILEVKNPIFDILTDTGLCGALRAMRIFELEFLSKNEKRSRKRRGAKCPRKGHTVLWRNFFSPVSVKS